MTPKEALEIFRQIRENLQATGKQHDQVREAYEVLKQLVEVSPSK